MVSELAGEGAMPPQLPAPASRSLETVELRFRHRKQIRRGSLLRRGVNVTKTIALFSPSFNRSRSVKFLSKVLNNPLFEVVYRSESVKSSSRVLDPPSIAIVSSWSRVLVTHLILSLLVDSQFAVFNPTSWSRSVKRSSAELVNPLFDSVCVQSLSVNPLFIASRSRSVERTSTSLDYQPRVCAVEIAQSVNFIFVCVSRSRRGEQPVLDSDSENGEGSPKDSNTRFLAVFNPSRVLVNAVFAVLDRDSWSRSGENTTAPENGEGSNAKTLDRVIKEEFSENNPPPPPQPKFAVKKHLRSKLPWRIRIHFSHVLCSLFIERFALVWLDTTKLLSDVYCRLMCMLLNPYNQTNYPECKSHPDSGLSAIAKLDPGYIIAQLSSVWKEWIKWCIEFGVDAHAITAVQYDWRLQSSKLEERDLYFHKLKLSLLTFETSLKHHGGQQIVFAHSLGVEDLGGMVELVESSVVDLDGIDVTKVGVAVYAEFCRDWGEALRMYDGAYHVLREMATSWCTDKMESSLIAMLKVVGLVAVVVKSLIDVLFGIGTDLYTGKQKNDDDPFANVSFGSNNGILGSSPKEKDVPQMDVYHVDSKFNEHDIPYVVLWLAFEHTDGRHYFTWDKMLFPNSEEMQEWLIAKGKKMVSFGGFLSMEKHFSIRNSVFLLPKFLNKIVFTAYDLLGAVTSWVSLSL